MVDAQRSEIRLPSTICYFTYSARSPANNLRNYSNALQLPTVSITRFATAIMLQEELLQDLVFIVVVLDTLSLTGAKDRCKIPKAVRSGQPAQATAKRTDHQSRSPFRDIHCVLS
jgi:hypothetical protein